MFMTGEEMSRLSAHILERSSGFPEGTPICAKGLLHLGSRAAVDQALSRLARQGKLMRVSRGVYTLPVEGRFGKRAPSTSRVVEELARLKGESFAPHGAAAANKLGLTTQVPTRFVYLTSGRSRLLNVGSQVVELRHAPPWQFGIGGASSSAGDALRALAWLGPKGAAPALRTLKRKLSPAELEDISNARRILPSWLAQQISETVVDD
jgi:hypothetical protein